MANFQQLLQANAELLSTPKTLELDDDTTVGVENYAESNFKRSDKYLWYEKYHDDNYSEIDIQKNIKIGKNQINLTQEENSQVIPFLMNRYYDGVDLTEMFISVLFVNKNGDEAESPVINLEYNDDKIRFYWLVNKLATAVEGKLKIEIHATGKNEKGENYVWKTKTNEEIDILKSLSGNGIIEPGDGWDSYVEIVNNSVNQAQSAAQEAKSFADKAAQSLTVVNEKIENSSEEIKGQVIADITNTLLKYYTREEVDALLENIDISAQLEGLSGRVSDLETEFENFDGLSNLSFDFQKDTKTLTVYNGQDIIKEIVLDVDPSLEWVTAYGTIVDEKIAEATSSISDNLGQVNNDLSSIHESIDNLPETLKTDYYDKESVNELLDEKAKLSDVTDINKKIAIVEQTANTNKSTISTISSKISELEDVVSDIDIDPNKTYEITKDEADDMYILWEIENEGLSTEIRTEKSRFKAGSTGSGGTSSTIKIEYITKSPITVTTNDRAIINYRFSGTDSSGDEVTEGKYVWKMNNRIIATGTAVSGENTFDVTDFISIGTQKLVLSITDDAGSLATKTWSVQQIDLHISSNFNDQLTYPIGKVSFDYTPYGAIFKTVHFKLDGVEIGTVNTTSSGIPMSYTLPSQSHGSHLLEAYITATVNNSEIETNHIYKDIIWYDSSSSVPVIGCSNKDLVISQYDTASITYTVFDPSTETPTVILAVDGKAVSTLNLDKNSQIWQYKATEIGRHTLTITCGQTVKTINVTVEKLDIDVTPVTAGLEFDFNPVGRSNNDVNRVWSDETTDISMVVSDNFDWVNGGYQIDENGDQYFCVKSGTTAIINYNLFADDPKRNGKEFKVIFKTTKVKNRKTSFITCMENNIGLDMKIESANVHSSNDSLYSPYCEEDIIEFEFNINKNTDIPMALTYEDGTANRPMIYTADASFMQSNPQPITIGSEDCDVHIYRMKAYSSSLSDLDIKNNYIADARNAEDMVTRYKDNQIYDENGSLIPEVLAEKRSDLKVIMVDAPWFTNDKSNKVSDTIITMIHKNGDPILDNWNCTGAAHSGQGTSSNEYGYAGRNLELIMNKDESLFTLGDGVTTSKTITLSRTSVPTNYLNVKVNIASSENENNAQFARRYNEYNPFKRTAKLKDSRVKDTMEFYNCVVFIRENNEDISTHREFMDTNWHFYAIGNVGDSKKTDNTRVNDENDPKECIIEITDYNVALAEFPTGKADESGKKIICPESEWKVGNTAYDYLYAPYKYKDGEFKSFGSESYEFRYEKKGITEEERQANIDAWRDFYKFVVTSDDEKFKADFEKYFVKDSALYFYLFTERYLMVDNRAKNSFWHYGKVWYSVEEAEQFKEEFSVEIESKYVDDTQAEFNDGYRWDLAFAYDMDTALGIDNTGKLVLTYGKEDTDYYVDGDPTSSYIYRAAESTFFCRIRDLFPSELQAMFVDRENANAWSADNLISQWDKAQSEFPKELVRLDIQRKYFRTYQGISIDNSIAGTANPRFLTEMLNGLKKYQRRMFERNQELYMATKYFGNKATQDQIMMRFNNPVGVAIKPNFTLKITPYSDMYIGVKFGNVTPINMRAKEGVEYTIPYSLNTADITLIYGASFIQAIGDLSKCYVGDNDFSKASRLQSLVIGSIEDVYENTFMTKISLGNNDLLEYLDIRNVTGLNSVVDLSRCNNLLELHAEGSGATGVIFSNGGKLQKAYLPSISSLTVKNLNNIEVFDVENYDNLLSLIVENTPFLNTYNIVNSAQKLNILRLIGMNWGIDYNLENSSILDRLLTLRGVGNDGYETTTSVLTGSFHTSVIKQKQLEDYKSTWKDLDVTYNTLVEQFAVTFENEDGTILDVQYVDKGGNAVDPITRKDNPIPTPTKKSTISTDFTFAKWSGDFKNIFSPRTITATYSETTRTYSITYKSKGITLPDYPKTGKYGDNIAYEGSIPTYTSEESAFRYYLFTGWDKSGIINGDKVVNAVFDSCLYTDGYFKGKDLSTLRPVEIYALIQLSKSKVLTLSDYVEYDDEITISFGNDYVYDDVESVEIIPDGQEKVFTGSNYHETDISLLNEDRDFVLAVDYKMSSETPLDSSLFQCYRSNAIGKSGFRLEYNKGTKVTWGNESVKVDSGDKREMIVIRHKKGESGIHVYASNLDADESTYVELSGNTATCPSTLVFGCTKQSDGSYENFAKGTIYWSKLWCGDLGDAACKKLVSWTHEKKTLKMTGFKKFYLSENPDDRCSMTFISDSLMDRKGSMSSSNSNSGGWKETELNRYMNSRMYEAINDVWKQLIKKVSIPSSVGNKSANISYSDCYLTIPSVIELDSSYSSSEPYISEGSISPGISTDTLRIRHYDDGLVDEYWTRSPNYAQTSYFHIVGTNGKILGGFKTLSERIGILIELSI